MQENIRKFKTKIKKNSPKVSITLGEFYLNQGNIKDAIPILIEAYRYNPTSKFGSTRTAVLLGDCFYKGYNGIVSKNISIAISLYNQAAKLNDTTAMIRLGDYYRSVTKDIATMVPLNAEQFAGNKININTYKEYYETKSKKFYEQAWKRKDVNALIKLLDYYPEQYTEQYAFEKMKKLQKKNPEDPDLNFQLGVYYQFNIKLKDDSLALEYYKKAAKNGHIKAINKLGEYYYNESFKYTNVELRIKQLEKAQKWWDYAAAKGSIDARSNLYRSITEELELIKNFSGSVEMINKIKPVFDKIKPLAKTSSLKRTDIYDSNFTIDEILNNPQFTNIKSIDKDISSREINGFLVVPEEIKTIKVEKNTPPPQFSKATTSQLFDFSARDNDYIDPQNDTETVQMIPLEDNLFKHYPCPTDVVQSNVTEDCYFLSSLASIASTDPYAILNAIRDNGDGTVTIRFYDFTKIRTENGTIIKDVIPIYYRVAKTIPDNEIRNKQSAPWVSLFEKAYVLHRYYINDVNYIKFFFSSPLEYINIDFGVSEFSTRHITGIITCENFYPRKIKNSDDLFNKIEQHKDQYYMTVGFKNEVDGITPCHAYSILGTKTVKYNGELLNLVIIRNPYGSKTTKSTISGLNESKSTNKKGIVVLTADSFCNNFKYITFNLKKPTSVF